MKFNYIYLLILFALPSFAAAGDWQREFSQLLDRYVKPGGVDYAAWHENAADLERLDGVAEGIAKGRPEGSRDARLAWYLNAYNALILDEILERYPYANTNPLRRKAFFSGKDLDVAGEKMSFDRLEHEIIRPEFKEPLIHFALNCASVSCPPLLDRAYTAERLDADLRRQALKFLDGSNPEGLRVKGRAVHITPLFQWFSEDFGDDPLAFINGVRDEPLPRDAKVKYLNWDWTLNES